MTPKDLAAARVQAGLTQRDLALRLGTTTATISRWETGERAISLRDAVTFAEQCHARILLAQAGTVSPISDPLILELAEVVPHLDPARRDDLAALVERWRSVKRM